MTSPVSPTHSTAEDANAVTPVLSPPVDETSPPVTEISPDVELLEEVVGMFKFHRMKSILESNDIDTLTDLAMYDTDELI
ncbi:MAG TPA: hypothetical protein VIQ31_15445, partial [Phormidium sp.]